jgi:hypothetical protein
MDPFRDDVGGNESSSVTYEAAMSTL